jgi:ABC-type amino acid transport system permease subunit
VSTETQAQAAGRTAGLFDLRLIIALLFTIFGLVVTIAGLVAKAGDVSASGTNVGINVNLWTGIPMLVLAALFGLWAWWRPVRLPAPTEVGAPEPDQQQ